MWTKALQTINRSTEWLTCIFLIVMVVIIFLQVVSRTFLQSSFPWTEELARYLMIWLTFLGAAFSFQYGAHIGIGIITDKLPKKLAAIIDVIVCILCIFLFSILLVKGWELVARSMNQQSPAMSIPMSYVYLIIPLSGILMILNVVDVTYKNVKKLWKGEET